MVETAFVLLVFLGFVFLIVDEAWAILAKLTLQHAVRSGVRYAVTSQTAVVGGKQLGQKDSIKQVVQAQSMGLLSTGDLTTYVKLDFCTVNPLNCGLTGVGANAAGNLVKVGVDRWPFKPIAPLLHGGSSIFISVSSADLIESSGSGTAPPPL